MDEGFDPAVIDDDLSFLDSGQGRYVPLTPELHGRIVAGELRLWNGGSDPGDDDMRDTINASLHEVMNARRRLEQRQADQHVHGSGGRRLRC